jgi:hypothetical protein
MLLPIGKGFIENVFGELFKDLFNKALFYTVEI